MKTGQLILDSVRQPVTVDGVEVTTDASVGITICTSADTRGGELLRRADLAMYQAKRARAGALLYDAELDYFSRDKLRLGEELRPTIPPRPPVPRSNIGRPCRQRRPVVLDHGVEIGNPADAPQPAPAIRLITYRTAHVHRRGPFKGTARNSYVLWEETHSSLCLIWVQRSELKGDGRDQPGNSENRTLR